MGDNTKIEWADASWNPVTGCSKVSAGCKHCYAERDWSRLASNPKAARYFGRQFSDVKCHPETLVQPLLWKRPRKVFVNSMADLFHEAVPFEFIAAVFGVMAAAPRHTFMVLTKRPKRAVEWFAWMERQEGGPALHAAWCMLQAEAESVGDSGPLHVKYGPDPDATWPLRNVWLGVTAENQEAADERIPLLLQAPAAVRFVSVEPFIGPLMLDTYLGNLPEDEDGAPYPGRLRWVVVGGESGPKARPMHPDWVRSLRGQCAAAGVPFMFKQWGEWAPTEGDTVQVTRVGKKAAGRLLDGREHLDYPITTTEGHSK